MPNVLKHIIIAQYSYLILPRRTFVCSKLLRSIVSALNCPLAPKSGAQFLAINCLRSNVLPSMACLRQAIKDQNQDQDFLHGLEGSKVKLELLFNFRMFFFSLFKKAFARLPSIPRPFS